MNDKKRNRGDAEIVAIKKVMDTLGALDSEARARVLAYVCARFPEEQAVDVSEVGR